MGAIRSTTNESTKNKILKYIFKQKNATRQNIAHDLHLSMPTVLQNITEMEKANLITESGLLESTGGRKATILSAVADNAYAIGVDITKNHVSIVVINMAMEMIAHQRNVMRFKNNGNFYAKMIAFVNDFIDSHKIDRSKIQGIGFSIPGILNVDGTAITDSHVLQITGLPTSVFEAGIPWKASFVNDASAAAWAELQTLEQNATIFYLSLSNSVGGAIVLNGELYSGINQRAGEIGHIRLVHKGKKCYCGQYGCADAYCSALVLAPTGEHLEEFFDSLYAGDPSAEKTWNKYLDYLALLIVDTRMLLDCDVVLGGYVGNYLEPWIQDIQNRVSEQDPFSQRGEIYIRASKYKLESSALGAAIIALEKYVSEIG